MWDSSGNTGMGQKKRTYIYRMENKKQFIKGILAGFLLTVLLGGVAFGGYRMLTKA